MSCGLSGGATVSKVTGGSLNWIISQTAMATNTCWAPATTTASQHFVFSIVNRPAGSRLKAESY